MEKIIERQSRKLVIDEYFCYLYNNNEKVYETEEIISVIWYITIKHHRILKERNFEETFSASELNRLLILVLEYIIK